LGPGVTELAALAGVEVRAVPAAGDTDAALAAGVAEADRAADEGADLLVVLGTGADVPVTAAVAALTGLEPAAAVTATRAAAWRRDVVAVRDLLRRARPHGYDPPGLLSTVDNPVLGTLAGLLLQAAVRRTPGILDGLAACAAAAVSYRLAPQAAGWWLVADRAGSPAQRAAVDLLRLTPVLDLGPPPGCAGPLLVPVLRAAARLSTVDPPGAGDPS